MLEPFLSIANCQCQLHCRFKVWPATVLHHAIKGVQLRIPLAPQILYVVDW